MAVWERKWMLPALLASAFLARLGLGYGIQQYLDQQPGRRFLIEGDAEGYWMLAETIASGTDYAVYTPPRRVMRMPGFPLLLAVPMWLFGESMTPIRWLLAGIGTLACGLTYWLGKQLFDAQTGLIAAALTAFSPTLAGFSVLVLSETAFAAALTASLIALAKLVRMGQAFQPAWQLETMPLSERSAGKPAPHWLAFVTGLLIALACYIRPNWLLVGPGMAVLLVVFGADRRRALWQGLLILVGMALALAPWAVRNYFVTGHVVVTTLWVGPSLYDSLGPQANGDSDMAFFERDQLMNRGFSEYEMDREYRRRAWEFAAAHPRRTLELALIKLGRYWKPWPNAREFQNPWLAVATAGFFVPVLLLSLVGWWTVRHRFWAWWLTLGPILYFAAIHTVFVGSLRYRLPAEYPLCVLAAVGLQFLITRFAKAHRPRSVGLS